MTVTDKSVLLILFLAASVSLLLAQAQQPSQKPATIASTINKTWCMIEDEFVSLADAMPDDKFSFAPTAGEFKGARTFGEQVQHVACANFAFFKEFNGITPDEDCRYNGQEPKMSKAAFYASVGVRRGAAGRIPRRPRRKSCSTSASRSNMPIEY